MDALLPFKSLEAFEQWVLADVLTTGTLIQALLLVFVLILALAVGRPIGRRLRSGLKDRLATRTLIAAFLEALIQQLPLVLAVLLLPAGILAAQRLVQAAFILKLAQNLLLAWVVIKLATSIIRDRLWAKLIALSAWTLAALDVLDLNAPAARLLDGLGFNIGRIHLTVLSMMKAVVILLVLLRVSGWLVDYLEKRIEAVGDLSPSTHVLLAKIIKISVFTAVVMIVLDSVGIDFTALAVFSGAVGVGVGFGLQKVVANFVAGIILLVDKSIKPGDVIQLGEVYGWITSLRGRYVSVITRDGTEYLIPNEDLITNQVVNWSFSTRSVRLKLPVGVSYQADPRRAMALMLDAARKTERVMDEPGPVCHLKGFGDSSVDLELRFWIDDPQNGISNVKSLILLEIWDRFQEAGIEIPYPQRDVHLDVRPREPAKG
ncbi:MAG: mechanosensitive ion channel [Proteobacteria bacterium]|nr:mechanosensitive ion channel [Pseudomonadota bacterium]